MWPIKIISYSKAIIWCVSCPTMALLEEFKCGFGQVSGEQSFVFQKAVQCSVLSGSTWKEPDMNLFPQLDILVHFFPPNGSFVEI